MAADIVHPPPRETIMIAQNSGEHTARYARNSNKANKIAQRAQVFAKNAAHKAADKDNQAKALRTVSGVLHKTASKIERGNAGRIRNAPTGPQKGMKTAAVASGMGKAAEVLGKVATKRQSHVDSSLSTPDHPSVSTTSAT